MALDLLVDESRHACFLDRMALEKANGNSAIDDIDKQGLIATEHNCHQTRTVEFVNVDFEQLEMDWLFRSLRRTHLVQTNCCGVQDKVLQLLQFRGPFLGGRVSDGTSYLALNK